MSKVSQMRMKELIENCPIFFEYKNIANIMDTLEGEKIKDFFKDFDNEFLNARNENNNGINSEAKPIKMDKSSMKHILCKYEDIINKELLIIICMKRLWTEYQSVSKRYEEALKSKNNLLILKLGKELAILEKNLKTLCEYSKDMIAYYTEYDAENRKVNIYASQELLEDIMKIFQKNEVESGQKKEKKHNKNAEKDRMSDLDLYFNTNCEDNRLENSNLKGFEVVLQYMDITDFSEIFPNKSFGFNIYCLFIDEFLLQRNLATSNEIFEKNYNEKNQMICDSCTEEEKIHAMYNFLKEYQQYVDFDKLLLLCGYSVIEKLENEEIKDNTNISNAFEMIKCILNCIHDKNKSTIFYRRIENEDNKTVKINFSIDKLKSRKRRFRKIESDGKTIENGKYITDSDIEKSRTKCYEGKITEVDEDILGIVLNNLSKDGIYELAKISSENLIYIATKTQKISNEEIMKILQSIENCESNEYIQLLENKKINIKDIINLYLNEKISKEQIEELIAKGIRIDIDIEYLTNYYSLTEHEKDEIERMEKYQNLCKSIIDCLDNDRKSELYEEVFNEIFKLKSGENKVIEQYYLSGILPLDIIKNWCGEDIIIEFFKNGIITLDRLIEFTKENIDLKNRVAKELLEIIYDPDVNYDNEVDDSSSITKLKCFRSGLLSEEQIFQAYRDNIIFEKHLRELGKCGIVNEDKADCLIRNIRFNEKQKNSSIELTVSDSLNKKKNDGHSCRSNGETKKNNVINIETRRKFIEDALGAIECQVIFKPNKVKNNSSYNAKKDNPFYNYSFYVLNLDENFELGPDSIIIAERYYNNKERKQGVARDNATYIFKYNDLLVLSGLRKSEMGRERDDIVFRSSHTVSTSRKKGSWAKNLLYGIAKAMLSSELREYSDKQKKEKVIEQLINIYSDGKNYLDYEIRPEEWIRDVIFPEAYKIDSCVEQTNPNVDLGTSIGLGDVH